MTANALPLAFDGACDCHVHVFENGYALAPSATFTPPHAPAARYRSEVQLPLGLQRVVIVQPTGYGFDNRCTLDALAQLGPQARAIAVLASDVPDDELTRLHALGVRGIRFMMLGGGVLPWSSLAETAARIAPLGWHINLQLDGCELPLHADALAALPCRLVIDHIGKFLARPVMPDDAAFLALRRLLEGGRCWVKLSAPYEFSRQGPPGYGDVAPLVALLAREHASQCLWASNWPHPNVQPTPSNAALLAWFIECTAGDAALQRRILADNPAALYGF